MDVQGSFLQKLYEESIPRIIAKFLRMEVTLAERIDSCGPSAAMSEENMGPMAAKRNKIKACRKNKPGQRDAGSGNHSAAYIREGLHVEKRAKVQERQMQQDAKNEEKPHIPVMCLATVMPREG